MKLFQRVIMRNLSTTFVITNRFKKFPFITEVCEFTFNLASLWNFSLNKVTVDIFESISETLDCLLYPLVRLANAWRNILLYVVVLWLLNTNNLGTYQKSAITIWHPIIFYFLTPFYSQNQVFFNYRENMKTYPYVFITLNHISINRKKENHCWKFIY